jgi:hypothetical protein
MNAGGAFENGFARRRGPFADRPYAQRFERGRGGRPAQGAVEVEPGAASTS